MKIAIITGSSGLIGSAAVRYFATKGFKIIGIDNDMRKYFFGNDSSTQWLGDELSKEIKYFELRKIDIRDDLAINNLFNEFGKDIKLIIHTAAQPSHDWAAKEPLVDFHVNATGTLNLLEATRKHCPKAVFIFTSTNKVYGDNPNRLPLVETDTRWELKNNHDYYNGIDEFMSIDHCKHSLFGVSKAAADLMVQEYGKYFEMNTAVFRGGCLTGPDHSGAALHGFLSYLMKCTMNGTQYNILGYKGKQVRDNIHSIDLVKAFDHFYGQPRQGEVYNIGGSRFSNCSMLEAIQICEKITGNKLKTQYVEDNRIGDHIWYISDISKFKSHYPQWALTKNIEDILGEIYTKNLTRWANHNKLKKAA